MTSETPVQYAQVQTQESDLWAIYSFLQFSLWQALWCIDWTLELNDSQNLNLHNSNSKNNINMKFCWNFKLYGVQIFINLNPETVHGWYVWHFCRSVSFNCFDQFSFFFPLNSLNGQTICFVNLLRVPCPCGSPALFISFTSDWKTMWVYIQIKEGRCGLKMEVRIHPPKHVPREPTNNVGISSLQVSNLAYTYLNPNIMFTCRSFELLKLCAGVGIFLS